MTAVMMRDTAQDTQEMRVLDGRMGDATRRGPVRLRRPDPSGTPRSPYVPRRWPLVTIVPRPCDAVTPAGARVERVADTAIDPANRPSWKAFGYTGYNRQFVYYLFSATGDLLYVGITWHPQRRWTTHSKQKAWWPQVARVELYVCSDADARAVETWAIKTLAPVHNIHQAVRR